MRSSARPAEYIRSDAGQSHIYNVIQKEVEDITMRQIARSIAHETMKRAGFTRINRTRPGLGGRSYFAVHWRDAVQHALNHPDQVYARA